MSPITSDSIPAADAGPEARKSRLSGTPEWLLRVSVESLLIVLSILLALFVDEWRDQRKDRFLARQSLEIFERELRNNLEALGAVIPYHNGLKEVAVGMAREPDRVVEILSLVEGLQPVELLNTAWETALATGALTRMDVETVSALSLTYSRQQQYRDEMRAGLPRLVTSPATTEPQLLALMQQAVAYFTAMVRSEQDLHAIYLNVLEIITDELGVAPIAEPTSRDSVHY